MGEIFTPGDTMKFPIELKAKNTASLMWAALANEPVGKQRKYHTGRGN